MHAVGWNMKQQFWGKTKNSIMDKLDRLYTQPNQFASSLSISES